MHQNFLGGFKGPFLLPRFHQQLLGQYGFHRSENFFRNRLQMLVQIHADEIAMLRGTEPLPRYSLTPLKTGVFR